MIDFEKKLNPRQWEACSYIEGPLLILAGAGSGKTRVITHRIAYLIEVMGVKPYNILAITFTNKAATEMKTRVLKLVEEGAEDVWVSTFHSMCVRILRRFYNKIGGQNNFTIYDADDQKAVAKEAVRDLKLDEKQYTPKGMVAAISKAKEDLLSPEDYMARELGNFRGEQIARVYKEYEKRLEKNNALDFDDLLNKTVQLFMECPEVLDLYQTRFRYIMVDEYQDTNNAQFVLVKLLAAKHRGLCVVGDDDQSIYKFRGANIGNILNFEDEYPDAEVIKLEQNYRSTGNILNAANAVIANNVGRKDKSLWTDREAGEKLKFTAYESDREEAAGVAKRIILQSKAGRQNSDMAVLYRTNAQSRAIEESLVREGIPYRLVGGTGFYDRREIRDLVGYLKSIANPADDQSLARIINVPRRGIGDSTVQKMREYADQHGMSLFDVVANIQNVGVAGRSAGKVEAFADMMKGFREEAEKGNLHLLYMDILEKTDYRNLLLEENTEEARGRVENIDELGNKIAEFEMENEDATLLSLLEEISLVADTNDDDGNEKDRVTLMTLHSAKGLEFPVVFMVGMEDQLFPSKMALESDDPDAEEEERRLCYVGITRAMDILYLSMAKQRILNGVFTYPKKSRFIDEIPKNLMETTGAKVDDGFAASVSNVADSISRGKTKARGDQGDKYYDEWGGSTFQKKKEKGSYAGDMYVSGKPKEKKTDFVLNYKVGDQVRHIKYGRGTVLGIIPEKEDYEVTVRFDSAGEKKMFASLAKLRKV